MSWHWVGPAVGGTGPIVLATSADSAARAAAVSSAVGTPDRPRSRMVSATSVSPSSELRISCIPMNDTTKAPEAWAFAVAAMSSLVSPCSGAAVRSLKIRGELTMAACSGCASGTLMTSIRNSAEFESTDGSVQTHPASSLGERTLEEPEMYTYTLSASLGSTSSECVCDPRQVCTLPTFFGCAMSLMSKIRSPRSRALLTVSGTPSVPQSSRPESPSPETNSRFRYTDTSLCDAGQTKAVSSRGLAGLEMSQNW